MIACVCGGFELLLLIPLIGWIRHLIRCKPPCKCACSSHTSKKENPIQRKHNRIWSDW